MIKVRGLNKYFNKGKGNQIHVIDNTSFELPSTGLISFLGHSGSGKTTLLNVLGGLDKAKGSISYDGLEFNKYNMRRIDEYRSKHIGYVFQNYNLLLSETVFDNLRIALELIGVTDPEEINKRIEYTLKKVGMYKFRKKKAFALSGGQQQRVSIARALVKNCRIIIADEPTGNLDSNNTIEVMNILKKISKNALVLLVTHEKNIADFYSDYIFELKDGKIVSQSEMSGEKVLQRDTNNVAYLKDMKLSEENTSLGNIKLYTEDDAEVNLDLSFIVKNGTIYLKTDAPIKLVSNSNLKIVDDHYQHIESTDVDDFSYDTSWYKDLKTNKNWFKKLLLAIKNSFISFKNVKKRVKFIYVGLACIGIVCGIGIIALTNASVVDESYLYYNRNYHELTNDEYEYSEKTVIEEAYENGYIDNVISVIQSSLRFDKQIIVSRVISSVNYSRVIPYQEGRVDLAYGNYVSTDDEIIISKSVADSIIKAADEKLSHELLIGESIEFMGMDFTICGISEKDKNMGYISFNKYCNIAFSKGTKYSDGYYVDSVVGAMDVRYEAFEVDINKNPLYTITRGEGFTKSTTDYEILVPENVYVENKTINLYGIECKVVGAINHKYGDDIYVANQKASSYGYGYTYYPDKEGNYEIVEGVDIANDNEILASVYSNYEIGQKVSGKTVVGKFNGTNDVMSAQFISTYSVAVMHNSNYLFIFDVVDLEAASELALQRGFKLNDSYSAQYLTEKQYNQEIIMVFEILFVVLAIVSSIFIYFIMRSKMISDIYTIGVYRSLGASRIRINRKYLLDSFVLTTFTVLIGYVFCILIYTGIANLFNDLFGEMELLKASTLHYLLGGVAIYVIMIFFGMLPIIMLMRKTPSEICSKYDI